MDLQIVQHLDLPQTAVSLITQYSREIHPTAKLIKALKFYRDPYKMYYGNRVMHTGITVQGAAIRIKDPNYPEIFPRQPNMRGLSGGLCLKFCYSKRDGEWLPHTQSCESDEEESDEEESDDESDTSDSESCT